MATDYYQEVTAGMEWLNSVSPEFRQWDYSWLDLSNYFACMLGINGLWDKAWEYAEDTGPEWFHSHGFALPRVQESPESYAKLTAAWRAAIAGHPSFCSE